MKVLVVGGGGREHALARALAASPRVSEVLVTPGNGGICGGKMRAVLPVAPTGAAQGAASAAQRHASLVALARQEGVGLTVVGPEAPLAAGLVDDFLAAGLRCFGPTAAAARLESSKAWSRKLMARHGIPTPRFATFTDEAAALRHVQQVDYPVVIKASGLAGGKGVLIPADIDAAIEDVRTMFGGRFGDAGREVVIEEFLHGREASLLVFTDGRTAVPMPVARDHKRLLEGERGPNTGGMGALAPDPGFPVELVTAAMDRIIHPTLFALREVEGTPYVGALYAGLMVDPGLPGDDPNSLKVLEFNCRFGDPEAQVLLPLLETDLVDVLEACIEGRLAQTDVQWRQSCAASVVVASSGYPGSYQTGLPIEGLDTEGQLSDPVPGVHVVHAGTARDTAGHFVTAGGRVLAVTAVADDLASALGQAYASLEQIRFRDMVFRDDIGAGVLEALEEEIDEAEVSPSAHVAAAPAYRAAGVDLAAAERAVALLRDSVESTHDEDVLSGVGLFAGMLDARRLGTMRRPVLVASTDGVGTKSLVAAQAGQYRGLGVDVVNHCVNDILVHGARPLFFLDYIATSRLAPEDVAAVVAGAAAACRAAGCALLGGETAEMPGVYTAEGLDVVGTLVGLVEREAIIDGQRIAAGDVILALPSSGLHTNGFSLARRALAALDWFEVRPELEASIAEALLVPHRSYLPEVERMLHDELDLRGLVHVTGGGLVDNPPRILPSGLAMRFDTTSWKVPALFELIAHSGDVSRLEMMRVFNMGVGMLVVLPEAQLSRALSLVPEAWRIGTVVARNGGAPVVLA